MGNIGNLSTCGIDKKCVYIRYIYFCLYCIWTISLYIIQTYFPYLICTKGFCPCDIQEICLHVVQTKQLCLYEIQTNLCIFVIDRFFCLYYIQTTRLRMIQTKSNFLLNIGSLYYTVQFIQQVDLLLPLGTLIPPLLLLFHIFGFIVTQVLIYISFTIAPNIFIFPDKVSLLSIVTHIKVFLLAIATNNTVVEPHFFYGVACR